MALTVGTDAYDSLANVRAYWAARGDTEWAALTDAAAEVLIRKATDWVDRTFEFIGDKATASQRLKWYRNNATVDGFLLSSTEMPWQIEEATAQVAEMFRLGSYDMLGIVTNDSAAVTKQKVDVVEVEFDAASRLLGGAIPSHVYELLRPLIPGSSGGLKRA